MASQIAHVVCASFYLWFYTLVSDALIIVKFLKRRTYRSFLPIPNQRSATDYHIYTKVPSKKVENRKRTLRIHVRESCMQLLVFSYYYSVTI